MRFTLNGRKFTAAAPVRSGEYGFEFLVTGLRNGPNTIGAQAGKDTARLRVINHPISGPVFSGPHLPILCTADPGLAAGTRARRQATCAAKTTTEYLYRSTTTDRFEPTEQNTAPADAAVIVVGGREVPEVIRYERGTINRSPYSFAVPTQGWNHRLVYQFGGGCNVSYSQGSALGTNVLDDALLSKGYAVATANFNTFQTSCNDVISAETAMMVKERFSEHVGVPRFTIGTGASGGAIQQLMIAQNYPGILDALSPVIPFPDAISTAPGVSDCGLLTHYYDSAEGSTLTDAQRIAINGHASKRTCEQWVSLFLNAIDPYVGCDSKIPADQIFSDANPRGIRCTLQDFNRNQFGVDPRTGFAHRPLDNVGVQYGLEALRAKTITVDEFLDLNEEVGGFDINGKITNRRERATRAEIERAYATGRVLSGGGNIKDIPIIMVNLYSDDFGDIHDRFRLFGIRDRLRVDGERNPNVKIWTRPSDGDLGAALTGDAFDPAAIIGLLDEWLTTGEEPSAAHDNCVTAEGDEIAGDDIYETGPCHDQYPLAGDPRTAAGAPLANHRIKCRLTPVNAKRYGVPITSAQGTRLKRIFPDGVCNWNRRGVGQVPVARTWIDYGHGPFASKP